MTETTRAAATPPLFRRPPLLKSIVRGVLLGLAITVAFALFQVFANSNFKVVVPNLIYRSSQLDQASLDKIVRQFGIRTVINLRGYCAGQPWYAEEGRACAQYEVSQEDLGFSAGRLPTVSAIRRLVEVLDRSEYPILFHCFRGVDRTGLASVMVLLLKTDTPLHEARRELALRHIHLTFGRTGNLDRFFDFYETWLTRNNWEHSSARFRQWVTKEYRGGINTGRIELLGHVLVGAEQRKLPAPSGEQPTGPNRFFKVTLPQNRSTGLPVRFHNTSDETWVFHPSDSTGVHAFLRLLGNEGELKYIARAGRCHARVAPGEHIDLTLLLPSLSPGKYFMQAGMVEEQHCFFQEVGMDMLNVELEVQ